MQCIVESDIKVADATDFVAYLKLHTRFSGNEQEDAHEFFNELLDKLAEELILLGRDNLIEEMFFGKLIDSRGTSESFRDIKIRVNSNLSFEDRIRESLTGGLQRKFENLPSHLQFHIQRFDYDPVEQQILKRKDFIELPPNFTVPEDTLHESLRSTIREEDLTYYISNIIAHVGNFAGRGHYVCYNYDEWSEKYYLLNDEKVGQFAKDIHDGYFHFMSQSKGHSVHSYISEKIYFQKTPDS